MAIVTRKTSIVAYEKIKTDGLLGEKQFVIYDVLWRMGPLTAGEIFQQMRQEGDRIIVKGGVSARLTELRQQGIAEEVGERECRVTGHTVIEWDVNDSLPVAPVKTESKDQIIQRQAERIAELEKEIVALRAQLPKQRELWN